MDREGKSLTITVIIAVHEHIEAYRTGDKGAQAKGDFAALVAFLGWCCGFGGGFGLLGLLRGGLEAGWLLYLLLLLLLLNRRIEVWGIRRCGLLLWWWGGLELRW
jgi:hypothetical protein